MFQHAQSVVFIDANVSDVQHLVNGVLPEVAVKVLAADVDGIAQITNYLETYPASTVHIVSHGAPGVLFLGNTQLNLTNLDAHANVLASWFSAEDSESTLLLYGCNVGAGDAGAEFIEKLHRLTGAILGASTQPIGNGTWNLDATYPQLKYLTDSRALSGDWTFEVNVGRIKTSSPFAATTLNSYQHTLDPVNLPLPLLNGPEGVRWTSFSTDGSMSDGSLNNAQFDAYDGALRISVNGASLAFPTTADLTGQTLTFSPTTAAGLDVSLQHYADPNNPVLRSLYSFQNSTGAAITITVGAFTNLGSDGNEAFVTTSSGDTIFDISDRWLITDDTSGGGGATGDPAVTQVFYGPNASVIPVSASRSFDNVTVQYSITIPENSTRSLLLFNGMAVTNTNAVSAVSIYDSIDTLSSSGLLNGLTSSQLSGVVNWGGMVTIDGTITQGQILTANTSTLTDAEGLGTLSYQWQQSSDGSIWNNIDGATGATFSLRNDQVNQFLQVEVSYMDGQGNSESLTSAPTSRAAKFNATSDFNDDGSADIFWRNQNVGESVFWLMDNINFSEGDYTSLTPPVEDVNWEVKALGDLNGDGKADLVWQNKATNQAAVWLMDGVNLESGALLSTDAASGWSVVESGDFNDNGKDDLLWRNSNTGELAVWLMDGTDFVSGEFIALNAGLDWEVGAVGDFTNDGKTDIFWENRITGANAVWKMDGTTFVEAYETTAAAAEWKAKGAADFNQDGNLDLLWHNPGTGENALWLMDGTDLAKGIASPTVALLTTPPSWNPLV
ncbi:MAG: DUF4347 domain-containing protein [Nodosilinea sp. WJT8-NPBG4]|jgi:hypothetical protein|nr:DUF4347 domain-containing protein [Nodosilinea sp. WJT8-NPBG4]